MERRGALLASTQGGGVDIDNYLTIVALEDGLTATLSGNTVEYCVDGDGNWKTLASNANSESINKGQTLSFRGTLTPTSSKGIGRFTISKSCDLTGNCNSLLFGDDAADNLDLTGKNYAFYYLFRNCSTIRNVSSNFLPATTLANYCYRYMFYGCSSLVTAPELPATTLKNRCYDSMFFGCSSLTTAPKLPATTLTSNCYQHMFYNCTSLTAAPQLPATTLASNCYHGMFYGTNVLPDCSNINFSSSIVVASGGLQGLFAGTKVTDGDLRSILPINSNGKYYLPCTTLANNCYANMFSYCRTLTTAPQLPATTLENYCYQSMFRDCTSLTAAPELPATTLKDSCYYYMFYGCSKLNYIKAMFTTTPSSSYTIDWVSGVASSGTFIKNKNATWSVTGTYGIPSGWTVQTA